MVLPQSNSVKLILVFVLTVPLSAVTVTPALCPTNKIAPHRRIGSWDQPRTLGAFYDLLATGPGALGNQQYDPSFQEEPQKDDLEDCGDIDDYDENDLSSLTPQYQQNYRRQGEGDSKLFFGLFNQPQQPQYPAYSYPEGSQGSNPTGYPQRPQGSNQSGYPQRPQGSNQPEYPQRPQGSNFNPTGYPQRPQRPQRLQRPQQPHRPPYSSGGYFESNSYRPPVHHYPSDEVKPVHEGNYEPQTTYRPGVVGGPIGHVVGVTSVPVRPRPRPTRRQRPDLEPVTDTPSYVRYPPRPTQNPTYTTKRPRPRNLNNNDSIFGSFFDLLF